jgi:hypothetical protein
MPWGTEHAADRRDPIEYVEGEHLFDLVARRLCLGRDVTVHLGQPRHQEMSATIDPGGSRWNLDIGRRAHSNDPLPANHHGVVS